MCNGYLTAQTVIKRRWKKLAAGIVMLALIKLIDRFVSFECDRPSRRSGSGFYSPA